MDLFNQQLRWNLFSLAPLCGSEFYLKKLKFSFWNFEWSKICFWHNEQLVLFWRKKNCTWTQRSSVRNYRKYSKFLKFLIMKYLPCKHILWTLKSLIKLFCLVRNFLIPISLVCETKVFLISVFLKFENLKSLFCHFQKMTKNWLHVLKILKNWDKKNFFIKILKFIIYFFTYKILKLCMNYKTFQNVNLSHHKKRF